MPHKLYSWNIVIQKKLLKIHIRKQNIYNIITSYPLGHLTRSSSHNEFNIIQPKPGKKSVRYNNSKIMIKYTTEPS